MKIDMVDVFAGGIGFLFKQIAVLALAICAGCLIGAGSLLVGELVQAGSLSRINFQVLPRNPIQLVLTWMLPNVICIGAAAFWMIRMEGRNCASFGIFAVIEGLIVIAGRIGRIDGWLPLSAAWGTFAVIAGMMGAALWFLHQWQVNRWAGELAMLKAENAVRRSELEKLHGTSSTGFDEISLD